MSLLTESPLKHWNKELIKHELDTLKHTHVVVLDIETTGLSPAKGGRIIEIGAVRLLNGVVDDTYQTFIDPQMKISTKTTELTGITQEMVFEKRTIGQVLPEFAHFIGDALVVAHNAKFDWTRFLLPAFKESGLYLDNPVLCTYELFRKADPGLGKGAYKLATLCTMFGVVNANQHRAIDDALATSKVFIGIQNELLDRSELKKTEYIAPTVAHTNIVVKRVKYWEMRVSPSKMMRRHYVQITDGEDFGTIYFDIATRTWHNKDFNKPLDFLILEKEVLSFLSLKTTVDLCSFKN